MTDKELNSIGQWLNSKGYDLDLTDCFWMEDWIANETKFRDIAELLLDYHKEQLLIHSVSSSLPNVYKEPHNSERIKFYKHLSETMNISEYATRHIFNEACDWYKTLT